MGPGVQQGPHSGCDFGSVPGCGAKGARERCSPWAGGDLRGRERCSQCHLAGWLGQGWQAQGHLVGEQAVVDGG